MTPCRRPLAAAAWAVALATAINACGAPVAPSGSRPNAADVAAAVTEDGIRARLDELAVAAEGSDAYRALGSTGFDAAADLVAGSLRSAGWTVTEDPFTTPAFGDQGGSTIEVGGRTFGGADVRPLVFAPSGDVEGPVVAVDWDPAATGPSAKGCREADYGDLPPGAIVLVRSAPCYRRVAVMAARDAGASGFVAVLPHAPSGAVLRPTLIVPDGLEIPAAAVSSDGALALAGASASGQAARLVTRVRTWPAETRSVFAELPGETGDVVMLGAHLDSVIDGPGLNDNGTGVAALLELARALGGTHPRATIRLAFWTGEEAGVHGSSRYVEGLEDGERDAIVAYLNVDMIGSPNGFVGVYDEAAAVVGSGAIRDLLAGGLERLGATTVGTDLGGGSDHGPFQQAGIRTGGVFSGAAEPLTAEEAATFSGRAGAPADPCYHLACDVASNVNLPLARLLAAGLADLAVRLANNPELLAR